jgi:hypothetical protein
MISVMDPENLKNVDHTLSSRARLRGNEDVELV